MQSLNTFLDHAPKIEWLKDFFDNPESFLENNQLGVMQIAKFRRFLYDAEFVNRKNKTATDFTALIKKNRLEHCDCLGIDSRQSRLQQSANALVRGKSACQ